MLAARLIDTGSGFAGGWNFGCDRDAAVDVITLADLVVEKWNGDAPRYLVEKRANEPPEFVVLRLDSTKSYVQLGWKPLLSIGEAVSKTVEWHLRYQSDPGSIQQFSQQQIAEYAAAWTVSSEKASEPGMRVAACV